MRKIRTKMITILTLSSAALGLGLGALFIFYNILSMQKAKRDELLWMARSYASELGQTFEVIEDQVDEITNYVKHTIDIKKLRTDKNYLSGYEAQLDKYLKMFATSRASGHSGWVYFDKSFSNEPHDVYYTDSSGDKIPERQEHIPFSYYDETPTEFDDKYWFYGPKNEREGVWTNPYDWILKNGKVISVTSFAEPIIIDGEFIGVAGSYYPFDEMTTTIENIKVFKTGFASLYNEKLDVIVHPEFFAGTRYTSDNLHTMLGGEMEFLASKIDNNKSGVARSRDGFKTQIYAYSALPNGWILCLEPVTGEMYAEIYRMVFVLLIVIIVCTSAVAAAASYWGRKLSKPIETLTAAAEEVASGDLSVRVDFKTDDEMEILGSSFNNMILHIQGLREKLEQQAFYDELTGLRNLTKFKIDAKSLLEKNKSTRYMAVKVDIDMFKLYNQMFGFVRGDRLLKAIALAGSKVLDSTYELAGHITADEFVFLIKYESMEQMDELREKFISAINETADLSGFKLVLPTGRYLIEEGSTNVIEVFEHVNLAHRAAKTMPDPKICDYDGSLSEQSLKEHEIERVQEDAVKNRELEMYLQPKFNLKNSLVVGAEALVRWKTSEGHIIYPNDFIPVFEKNGFIAKLDMYMLRLACETLKKWLSHGLDPIVISINFSRLHFSNPLFIDEICQTADDYGVPHRLIEIELTETAIFENIVEFQRVMKEAHLAGFSVSMDDFGTGYSSLGLLKDLSVDTIKLDRSFFISCGSEEREHAVISSVIDMAHKLNIETVAEGVEDIEHVNFLSEIGCDIVQGFYFEKAVPVCEYEKKYYNF